MIQWYLGQIEFRPPGEGYVAPFCPVLFYKWKVWLWNPSSVSCCWSISTWPQGAQAQGMDEKAFDGHCSLTGCQASLRPSCNNFCHVSVSEGVTDISKVSPSNRWVVIRIDIHFTWCGWQESANRQPTNHYNLVPGTFSGLLNWHYPPIVIHDSTWVLLREKKLGKIIETEREHLGIHWHCSFFPSKHAIYGDFLHSERKQNNFTLIIWSR